MRKLLFLAPALLWTSTTWAIEIGEPQVRSHLGAPMDVLLPVVLGDLEPKRVQARLLQAGEYSNLDLPSPPISPGELTLSWQPSAEQQILKLTGRSANPEPLIYLAVELSTPRLRVIRAVTLLFDPRTEAPESAATATEPAKAIAAPVTQPRLPAAQRVQSQQPQRQRARPAVKPAPSALAGKLSTRLQSQFLPPVPPGSRASKMVRFQMSWALASLETNSTAVPTSASPSAGVAIAGGRAIDSAPPQTSTNPAQVPAPSPGSTAAILSADSAPATHDAFTPTLATAAQSTDADLAHGADHTETWAWIGRWSALLLLVFTALGIGWLLKKRSQAWLQPLANDESDTPQPYHSDKVTPLRRPPSAVEQDLKEASGA